MLFCYNDMFAAKKLNKWIPKAKMYTNYIHNKHVKKFKVKEVLRKAFELHKNNSSA